MSRLRHDLRSYMMALRMAGVDIIIFMEGKDNDPNFYAELAQRYTEDLGSTIELRRAQELPGAENAAFGGSGGKAWLLRNANLWLKYKARGKTPQTCKIAFALDKDVDDVFGRRRDEAEFLYTPTYSVESLMVSGTDLAKTVASAFSLLPGELAQIIGQDQSLWMRQAQLLWKAWMTFCLVARAYPKADVHGFSRASRFNLPAHSPADPISIARHLNVLVVRSGAQSSEFTFVYTQAENLINQAIVKGRGDCYFKGEWYVDILLAQIQADALLKTRCSQVGKNGIWGAIRATFQISETIYDYYREALNAVP